MRFFSRILGGSGRRSQQKLDCLDRDLVFLSQHDGWRIRHAVEGTLVVGGTGSGKSTATAPIFARAFLGASFGGLVLTVKGHERQEWEELCKKSGRSSDLVVIGPDASYRYNFLNSEVIRKGAGAGITENVLNILVTLLEIAERKQNSNGTQEEYWRRALSQMCRNVIDLLILSKGHVSVPDLYRVVVSIPTSFSQLHSDDWKKRSFCFQCLSEADQRPKSPRQKHDFGIVADYFCKEIVALSDKTRSVIISTFTSMIDVLNRGVLREIFCTDTNITPDAVLDGKILLLDFPVKEFGEVGLIAQGLFKRMFQLSIERRIIAENPRPVFLYADEAQNFFTSYDFQFQTTCRSARVATFYLTQNINNIYAALGGNDKARTEGASLLGNLSTKIFHANSDHDTNEYAANLCGRCKQLLISGNNSYSGDDFLNSVMGLPRSSQSSAGFAESWDWEIQPSDFSRLRTGGPGNGWCADVVVFQNGRVFRQSGRTYLKTTFRQEI